MDMARAAAKGNKPKPSGANEIFYHALANSLSSEQMPSDSFVYHPICSRCNDTGMVGECNQRYCSCVLNESALRLREITGLRPDFTFQNFDLSIFPEMILPRLKITQREMMEKRKQQCMDYAASFPDHKGKNLLLIGGTGLGKTYLLQCVANDLIDRGYTAMMTTAYQLVQISFNRQRQEDTLSLYEDADLLIIDDLGSEPMYQKVTVETLLALINSRLTRCLPLAFSTNLNPSELNDRYGTRMASRLLDRSCVTTLLLEGEDVRLAKK
jgi:DNA replication protein DnaC